MRFPQVSERVKEAPAHALRAVFAGIGQVRLVTDRMKNKRGAEEQATSTRPGGPATAGTTATEATAATPVAEDTAAGEAAPAAEATPAADPAPAAAAAEPAAAEPAAAAEGAPPMANYEQLTIASFRARLRGLTIVQVRELMGYERAHANRPDVIAMFERRVAKLEAPGEG